MPTVSVNHAVALALATACLSPGAALSQVGVAPVSIVAEAPNGPWSLRKGERVRGTTFDGRVVDGRLLSESDSTLVIARGSSFLVRGESTSLRYADLARIEARRPPPWAARAMFVGVTAGLAVGAVLGTQSVENECSGSSNSVGPCFSRGSAGFIGALFGMGLGASTARLVSRPRWQLLSVQRRVPRDPPSFTPGFRSVLDLRSTPPTNR